MKKLIYSLVFLLLITSVACADIKIDENNFPDYTFRQLIDDFDTNNDAWLSNEEIAKVKEFRWPGVTVNGKPMYSLKGIEFFTELVSLDCQISQLSTLDLSNNIKLRWLQCKENNLTELNIAGCKNLEYLDCSINSLGKLDLSANTQLKKIDCGVNNLKLLDVSNHVNLVSLDCNMNYLESLNVNGCSSLNFLLSPNNLLNSLNIEGCSNLKVVNLNGNRLSQLDLRRYTELLSLDCSTNMLVSLDVSGCYKFSELYCQDNRLNYINLNGCTNLKAIDCSNNQIKNIDVSSLGCLVKLHCDVNRLSELNLSQNYLLESLRSGSNNITKINLENNSRLSELELPHNHIAELNLSGKTRLSSAHVSMDQQTLTKLNIISQAGNEYPFKLNFNEYISAVNINNVVASSVQGFDENNEKIDTVYSNGTAQFKLIPAMVQYLYNTGLNGVNMDVAIGTSDFLSLAWDHHVYRIFNNFTNWENARAYCKELGGDLAVITTDKEKKLVQELIKKARFSGGNSSGGYWLGAELKDSKWSWVDDEDFQETVSPVYTISRVINIVRENKIIRQVTKEYPEGVYLQVTEDGKFIGWHDLHPSGFICEWQPVEAEFAQLNSVYKTYIADPDGYMEKLSKFYGVIPDPLDLSHLSTNPPTVSESAVQVAASLPLEYNPTKLGLLPNIRNQSPYGTCWAFASLGALETSYIAQGFGSSAPDLSELHLAWFLFKDPRYKYARPSRLKKLSPDKHLVFDQGASCTESISFLSRAGTAAESDLPYNQANNVEALVGGKLPESYAHPIRLEAAYRLGPIKSNMKNEIKKLVNQYGAVWIAFEIDEDAFNNSMRNYYLPTAINNYHAVVIIGWDDNYSASNFKYRPSSDGAWLVRNSWGTEYHEDGYFWMSYEQNIADASVFIATQDTEAGTYGKYNYDLNSPHNSVKYHWSANVFRAQDDGYISEAGFYTRDNNTPYEIYMKIYGTTDPAKPGIPNKVDMVAKGTESYCGYHTVIFNEPVKIAKGEYFSVILKLSRSSTHEEVTAVENNFQEDSSEVNIAGKSYFAMPNSDEAPTNYDWIDGNNLRGYGVSHACIKAFMGTSVVLGSAKITTSSLAQGIVNEGYSFSLTASGVRPIKWTVEGLPSSLYLDENKIIGTPKEVGNYSVKITATNSEGSDTKTLELAIKEKSSNESKNSNGGGGCGVSAGTVMLFALVILMRKK